MASILIVAHQPLASALRALAEHTYSECSAQVGAVDVAPGTPADQVQAHISQALLALGSAEVLVMTDVFGATPCNAALAAADALRANLTARVVAGVNVPMLWRTLCYASAPLDDLVGRAIAGAAQGVMHVAVPHRQNQPKQPPAPNGNNASDDQDPDNHQQ
jgi:mannose PTS system EIIA component